MTIDHSTMKYEYKELQASINMNDDQRPLGYQEQDAQLNQAANQEHQPQVREPVRHDAELNQVVVQEPQERQSVRHAEEDDCCCKCIKNTCYMILFALRIAIIALVIYGIYLIFFS